MKSDKGLLTTGSPCCVRRVEADGGTSLLAMAEQVLPLSVLGVALDMAQQSPVPAFTTRSSSMGIVLVSDISGFTKFSEKHINDKVSNIVKARAWLRTERRRQSAGTGQPN